MRIIPGRKTNIVLVAIPNLKNGPEKKTRLILFYFMYSAGETPNCSLNILENHDKLEKPVS